MAATSPQQGSVSSASLWMLGLGILLFWIPPFGPFIAGFVGGRKAGSVGGAITAAIMPALVIGGLVVLIGALFGLPLISLAIGAIIVVALIFEFAAMILGAVIGGALAR